MNTCIPRSLSVKTHKRTNFIRRSNEKKTSHTEEKLRAHAASKHEYVYSSIVL